MSDASKYVKVNNPFHWDIANKWNYRECFKASATLQKKIDYYKSVLPANYSCLHARTEEDWYKLQCCKQNAEVNTTSIHPELWTCSEFTRERCYMTPKQIVDVLKRNLVTDSPLWISSGSSQEALQPIHDSFEVYSNKDNNDGAFIDYSLAEVDFAVCSGATTFWGMLGDSFSLSLERIIRESGKTFWYTHNGMTYDANKGRKYLVAELVGGLINQAVEIWISVLLAEKLNRTLVLPKVFAKIPSNSTENYAKSETSKPEPFNAIWDEEYFVQCARKKLNNPNLVVESNSAHYKVEIDSYHTYILERWDGVDNFTPILNNNNASNELASRLMSDASKYVKVNNPFHWDIANKWNYRECFKASATLQKKIDHYKSVLPANYSCLHARTEEDWYTLECCKQNAEVNTTSIHPELWTCSEFTRERCYMTPKQIVDVLETNLPLHSPLWVSSGSSEEVLQPIYDSYEVYSNKDDDTGAFMDYRVAEVDFAVCSGATTFFGMRGSSYSLSLERIIGGGKTFWYNDAPIHLNL
eukprot:scaffold101048_cov23-Cyclotella_meneghiniana.AAC.1